MSAATTSVGTMRFTRQRLNRTLLLRQHLLERVDATPVEMCDHLIGLQAQETMPPYLSLAARLTDFDPYDVSRALEERGLARVLSLRDTIHLHTPEDAVSLPVWAAPVREREIKVSQAIGSARELDRVAFAKAVAEVLADGPMPVRRLGGALATYFPEHTASQLGQLARVLEVLVQVPPRGCWGRPGGLVYEYADRWLDRPLAAPDVPALVRRYLRAFGPATAADVTAWSGITRLAPVLKTMDDLERHEDEDGRPLYDLAGAPVAEEDAPAPVRLLGAYDNVWLSHAQRDRVTDPATRSIWMGVNGAQLWTVFVDGWLEGLWHVDDGRVVVSQLQRTLTPAEQAGLDEEIGRVEELLAR